MQPIDDDGGLIVDEEWIEQVDGDVWTGSLYVDGTKDEEIETQNNLNHEEDLIHNSLSQADRKHKMNEIQHLRERQKELREKHE